MIEHTQLNKQLIVLLLHIALLIYSQACHSLNNENNQLLQANDSQQNTLVLSDENCAENTNQYLKTAQNSECGTFVVPLNPAAANGKQIQLNILRIPAIKPLNRSPLFILAGGPGQAATDLASSFAFLFRNILQKHDLVFVDQRGTGQSNSLSCDMAADRLEALNPKQKRTELMRQYKTCLSNSPYADDPTQFAFYTTPYAADDLEVVRKALGYKQINLWGASYGTRVGLQYLRQYPNAIRSAVLDGLSPIDIALPKWTNRDSAQALQKILSSCEAQVSCKQAYPNLLNQWKQLLEKVKNSSIVMTLQHPRTQHTQSVYIDDKTLSSWVRFALYVRDWSPLLPLSMFRATQLDFQTLYGMAIQGSEGVEDGISLLMHMSVICNEDYVVNQSNGASNSKKLPLINVDTSQYEIACPLFNSKSALSPRQVKPIKSDAPVLLLSGELDPATPPVWGKHVQNKLANSRHLIASGGHHGVTALGCTSQIITDFIEQGGFGSIETDCIKEIKPKPFFIDSAGPAMNSIGNISEQTQQASP